MIEHEERYYEIQYSQAGANDWFASGETRDTLKRARILLRTKRRKNIGNLDYRIVCKRITEEPMPDRHIKPLHGQCPECGHFGRLCTGANV